MNDVNTKATGQPIYRGPWRQLVAVQRCLCPDGKRRRATITREADTFFSVPARVTFKGKTVAGFVTGREAEGSRPDWEFIPYSYSKNGGIFYADIQPAS